MSKTSQAEGSNAEESDVGGDVEKTITVTIFKKNGTGPQRGEVTIQGNDGAIVTSSNSPVTPNTTDGGRRKSRGKKRRSTKRSRGGKKSKRNCKR